MIDRRAIRHAVEAATIAELPELIGALAEAQAIAQRRLLVPDSAPTGRDADELLDAAAMAARLAIQPSWLLDMARQGRVPCVRLGKYVRFRPADVFAWSESQTREVCDRS